LASDSFCKGGEKIKTAGETKKSMTQENRIFQERRVWEMGLLGLGHPRSFKIEVLGSIVFSVFIDS